MFANMNIRRRLRKVMMFESWSHIAFSVKVLEVIPHMSCRCFTDSIVRIKLSRCFNPLSRIRAYRIRAVKPSQYQLAMNQDEWFASLKTEVRCIDPFYPEAWRLSWHFTDTFLTLSWLFICIQKDVKSMTEVVIFWHICNTFLIYKKCHKKCQKSINKVSFSDIFKLKLYKYLYKTRC